MAINSAARNYVRLICSVLGFNPYQLRRNITQAPQYIRDLRTYKRLSKGQRFTLSSRHMYPVLSDYTSQAGVAEGAYFHQDLWAARKLYQVRPVEHLDVGSRIDGFVGHVLIFMPITVIDIRPLVSTIAGLNFIQDDATLLSTLQDNSVESVSSLHAVEHFGLGRYGDPIDPDGCFKAMASLSRVLKPGGRLYFSVPVGVERVEFNAHRVFAPQTILDAFSELKLISFSAVDDKGQFKPDCQPNELSSARMGCGLFEFTK